MHKCTHLHLAVALHNLNGGGKGEKAVRSLGKEDAAGETSDYVNWKPLLELKERIQKLIKGLFSL